MDWWLDHIFVLPCQFLKAARCGKNVHKRFCGIWQLQHSRLQGGLAAHGQYYADIEGKSFLPTGGIAATASVSAHRPAKLWMDNGGDSWQWWDHFFVLHCQFRKAARCGKNMHKALWAHTNRWLYFPFLMHSKILKQFRCGILSKIGGTLYSKG